MKEDVQTNARALKACQELSAHPQCAFQKVETKSIDEIWFGMAGVKNASPKIWMDSYLAAIAIAHLMTVVTFDRGFSVYTKSGLELRLLGK